MATSKSERVLRALMHLRIEIPSSRLANTGTRFGKFTQPAAASTTEEKSTLVVGYGNYLGAAPPTDWTNVLFGTQ